MTTYYTDGAYSRKSDCGGWAFFVSAPVLRNWWGRSGAKHQTTVNEMELQGIHQALVHHCNIDFDANVIIHTDSMYCVTVLGNERTYHKNAELIQQIRWYMSELRACGVNVSVEWVKGHSGVTGNVLADIRATRARDELAKRLAVLSTKA